MATLNLFSLQAAASGNRGAAASNRVVQTGYARFSPRPSFFPNRGLVDANLAPAECCPVQRWAIDPERARDARFQRARDCSSDVRPGVQPSARSVRLPLRSGPLFAATLHRPIFHGVISEMTGRHVLGRIRSASVRMGRFVSFTLTTCFVATRRSMPKTKTGLH